MSTLTATRTSARGTPRDLAVTALILGIAAAMWFGWGQAQPPSGWALPLNIGTFAAIAVAVGAGSIVARFRRGATAMADQRVRRGYGITVTGAFGGLVCIACAAVCLRRALRRGREPGEGGFRNS